MSELVEELELSLIGVLAVLLLPDVELTDSEKEEEEEEGVVLSAWAAAAEEEDAAEAAARRESARWRVLESDSFN